VSENAELVQSFRFAVWLTRSTSPGPTLSPPPSRTGPGSGTAGSAHAQRPAAGAPGAGANGTVPLGAVGGQAPGRAGGDLLGQGLFAECQGLELETDVKELLEGGANDAVVRRAGRVRLVPLLLRRGMFVVAGSGAAGGRADTALWDWLQGMVAGRLPVPRYNGAVEIRDPAKRRVVARWTFSRGLALKVSGPQLNAITGEIALETLTIAHEGLRLEAS
jgi:phage tail-like protein